MGRWSCEFIASNKPCANHGNIIRCLEFKSEVRLGECKIGGWSSIILDEWILWDWWYICC